MLKYNYKNKDRARDLRSKSTLSEVLLWKKLKNRQVKGYKFLRQNPISNYIVDFCCHQLKLIIEIDGGSHYENEERDKKRDDDLKKLGFSVLRIGDIKVKSNIDGVILEIDNWIDGYAMKSPTPIGAPPLRKGEFIKI